MEIPFGYRLSNGSLVPDENEQRIIELIRSLRRQGMSLKAIGAVIDLASKKRERNEMRQAMRLVDELKAVGQTSQQILDTLAAAGINTAKFPRLLLTGE
jgi:DNA-binding transcriptional MerR regulator